MLKYSKLSSYKIEKIMKCFIIDTNTSNTALLLRTIINKMTAGQIRHAYNWYLGVKGDKELTLSNYFLTTNDHE